MYRIQVIFEVLVFHLTNGILKIFSHLGCFIRKNQILPACFTWAHWYGLTQWILANSTFYDTFLESTSLSLILEKPISHGGETQLPSKEQGDYYYQLLPHLHPHHHSAVHFTISTAQNFFTCTYYWKMKTSKLPLYKIISRQKISLSLHRTFLYHFQQMNVTFFKVLTNHQ